MHRHRLHPQTDALMRGYDPMLSEGSVVPPLFRTSTFVFHNAEEGKRAFQLAYGLADARPGEVPALIYSRVNNPNVNIVEDRITSWDRTEAAALFSSGMGAISCAAMTFLRPGDDLLFADPIYGGTEFLFRHILPEFGIRCHSFPAGAPAHVLRDAIAAVKRPKMIYLETCANPTMILTDVEMVRQTISEMTGEGERPLVAVDNTFLGPIFCRPAQLGADLVIYSATKFIGGHSDLVAGAVLGSKALVQSTLVTRTIYGATPDPETAWLISRSLGTLQLRMEKQQESARHIAEFLHRDPRVRRVYYPGHQEMGADQVGIYHRLCTGSGSVMSFEIDGGEAEAFRVLNKLRVCKLAVSLGGIETLAEHPYTMTHAEMPDDLKMKVGITPGMIRLSVGLEDMHDIIADLRGGLEQLATARESVGYEI